MNLKTENFGAAAALCLAALAALAGLATTAQAQHPVPPTTVSGTYDQTNWTPIPIESCFGTGNGCTSVNGFDWLSDGRMVILTTDYLGQDRKPNNRERSMVSIITNPGSNDATVQTIATHFKQPAGVTVVNDQIWVGDMDTVYTIPDNDPAPGAVSTNRTPRFGAPLATMHGGHQAPWNFEFNKSQCNGIQGCDEWNSQSHHYIFTPVYYQGKFYAAYGGATGSGTGNAELNSSSFYGAAILVWDSATTQLDTIENRSFAGGLRSPNGTALGPNGSILVTDHQGSYLPMNTLTLYKVGAPKMQFGGYRQAPGFTPNFAQAWYDRGDADYVPPLAIHRYSRSEQVGWVGIAQPFYLTQGPYAGQILVGDINSPGLWRVALDTLPDTTGADNVQGTVFTFTPGSRNNSLGTGNAGINRITQGPDGTIYAGAGRGVGNWGNGPSQHLIYVFKPKENPTQFEIMNIRSLADGYELILNKQVDPATVNIAHFEVGQRSWTRQARYGLGFVPELDGVTPSRERRDGAGTAKFFDRPVDSVQVSMDSLRIRIKVPGILRINQERRGDTVTHWHTRFLFDASISSADGEPLYTTEADYAQNWISERAWDGGSVPIDTSTIIDTVPEDTTTALNPRFGTLQNNVWLARTPGVIHVNVDNMTQPYSVMLRDITGRVLFRREVPARTRATAITAPGATQAVYTVEVRSAGERYTRIVTF